MSRRNHPNRRRKSAAPAALTVSAALTVLTFPVAGFAQDAAPAPIGTQTIPQQGPPTLSPQPAGKTPPTPLVKEPPKTEKYGIKMSDVKKTTTFENVAPGQPLPSDPTAIRTIEDALTAAFRRNPNILQAQERAIKTIEGLKQILSVESPAINASLSYTRLANPGSNGAVGSGGVSPAQITNPFGVGLTYTPPGSSPVTLSSSGSTSGNTSVNASASGSASSTGTTGTTSGTTRSAPQSEGTTRQNTGGNNGNTDGNNNSFSQNLNVVTPRIQASWFIDITGLVRTARQLGDLELALSRLEILRNRQDTALQVRNSYYNLLRSIAFVSVNEASVAQSAELVRVTEAQQRAGVASQYDVLRARTQLQNNRQSLIAARNQVNISKNALANQIGIDPSTPIDPTAPATPATPTLDEDALILQAIGQRPEYAQADLNLLVAEKNIRLARRNLDPYINLNAAATYNVTAHNNYNRRDGASVGATLSIPISDGGSTKHQVEAARSDQRVALIQKDQFVRGIKAEVQQAIISVRDAQERSTAAEQSVVEAREAFRLSGVRFRAGVGTQLDVNDAQTALTQTETNRVNAEYDFLGSLARLSRAVGTPE